MNEYQSEAVLGKMITEYQKLCRENALLKFSHGEQLAKIEAWTKRMRRLLLHPLGHTPGSQDSMIMGEGDFDRYIQLNRRLEELERLLKESGIEVKV